MARNGGLNSTCSITLLLKSLTSRYEYHHVFLFHLDREATRFKPFERWSLTAARAGILFAAHVCCIRRILSVATIMQTTTRIEGAFFRLQRWGLTPISSRRRRSAVLLKLISWLILDSTSTNLPGFEHVDLHEQEALLIC